MWSRVEVAEGYVRQVGPRDSETAHAVQDARTTVEEK